MPCTGTGTCTAAASSRDEMLVTVEGDTRKSPTTVCRAATIGTGSRTSYHYDVILIFELHLSGDLAALPPLGTAVGPAAGTCDLHLVNPLRWRVPALILPVISEGEFFRFTPCPLGILVFDLLGISFVHTNYHKVLCDLREIAYASIGILGRHGVA
jgi:hypothetical protein